MEKYWFPRTVDIIVRATVLSSGMVKIVREIYSLVFDRTYIGGENGEGEDS